MRLYYYLAVQFVVAIDNGQYYKLYIRIHTHCNVDGHGDRGVRYKYRFILILSRP